MSCKPVLVVEDDDDIRNALQDILITEGYTVFCANNGQEGVDILKKMECPGLILLDLMMPVMNGWEFITVKDKDVQLAPIPVVVVSAVADRGKPVHARGFIKKPINLDVLLKVVSQYCNP
jgi:CheY-like chemotaxis protein